jgi:hypothetical protein
MEAKVMLDTICAPSENVVARLIEGELIIVPITSGIGDAEDELYTLNSTGQAIWEKLDGKRTLKNVVKILEGQFSATLNEIESDILGLTRELVRRGFIVIKNE